MNWIKYSFFLLIALLIISGIYYFTVFLPNQQKADDEAKAISNEFLLKQKCAKTGDDLYQSEAKEAGEIATVKIWQTLYSKKLNTCLIEISVGANSGNFYKLSLVDGLTSKSYFVHFRVGDTVEPGYLSYDEYTKQRDDFIKNN